MKTKQVEISGKTLEIKEIKYVDFLQIKKDGDYTGKLFELSGCSKETVDDLNITDGDKLLKEIIEFNGFSSFQKTPV